MFIKMKQSIMKGLELIGSHFEGRIDSDETKNENLY